MYYEVLVASRSFHGKEPLTYKSPHLIKKGQIVEVPLRQKKLLGIVVGVKRASNQSSVKEVLKVWDYVLPPTHLQLIDWLANYYPAPLGIIHSMFLPDKLGDFEQPHASTNKAPISRQPELTKQQLGALKKLTGSAATKFFLHGDTGTGKTRVYIEMTKKILAQDKSCLILTPEIGLTSPLEAAFKEFFDPSQIVIVHSGLTASQKRKQWLRVISSQRPLIVLGPRSALFMPIKDLGLIVMDEAHDSSYKQNQTPYYQASRVASQLANIHNARLILGTATPSVADYWLFKQKKLPIIRLTEPAIGKSDSLETFTIDRRDKSEFTKSKWLSLSVIQAVNQALENKEQSLFFLNRRGSARLTICESCGWQAFCPNCNIPLVYHHDKFLLKCHNCSHTKKAPTSCPECSSQDLLFSVAGTKQLEEELRNLFPAANIRRFDSDNLAAEQIQKHHQALQNGEIDIIVGTQTIAKGFDLEKLSVVAIVQADSGLQIPDFSANERTFQLLTQVSGRIGRGHRPGKLFIQTFTPENKLINWSLSKNYEAFFQQEILDRKTYRLPPFVYLLKLASERSSAARAEASLKEFVHGLGVRAEIIGPAPSFIEKQNNKYRWQIIVKSSSRENLLKIVSDLPANIKFDLDPDNLL